MLKIKLLISQNHSGKANRNRSPPLSRTTKIRPVVGASHRRVADERERETEGTTNVRSQRAGEPEERARSARAAAEADLQFHADLRAADKRASNYD